jgi:hypothetical protein
MMQLVMFLQMILSGNMFVYKMCEESRSFEHDKNLAIVADWSDYKLFCNKLIM